MTPDSSTNSDEQLTLSSRLNELASPTWPEQIASSYGIFADTQFAIDLFLEEVLTNIVLHGCAGSPDNTIIARCRALPNPSSLLSTMKRHHSTLLLGNRPPSKYPR